MSGWSVNLTSAEFNLLSLLLKNSGHVISRETLAAEGPGAAITGIRPAHRDLHGKIRRKLGYFTDGSARIQTVRGTGYHRTYVNRV